MSDIYKWFLSLERPAVDNLNEVIHIEGLKNVIIYRPLELQQKQIVNTPYYIETKNGLFLDRGEKLKLVPVFKSENKYSYNPSDEVIFMYPTDLMKELVSRETTVLLMNRVNELTLKNVMFNNYSNTYIRYGVVGLVTFFKHKESGDLYQYIAELEPNRLDDIFERPNIGLFKVRDGNEVNKNIMLVGNINIKYDLTGTKGFRLYLGDNLILEDIWSLDEAIKTSSLL